MKDKEKLEKLVNQLKLGNEESFSEIYNQTNKYIFYVIMKITQNEEQTFDLVQETYIQIYNKISSLEDPKAFLSWAGRIATNKTYRYMKKYRKELLVDEESEYIFDSIFEEREEFIPHEILESEEKKRLIRKIIESLSEVQKLTVYKYYFYMNSISQIAEDMECSEGTVKSRLNYARKKIEEAVLDLEKKGTKLYGVGALPVFFMLLREEADTQALSKKVVADTFKGISDGINFKRDSYVTNKAIGKSSLAKKAIKVVITLLITTSIAGGAIAIMFLDNNKSENINNNENNEISYSEGENIDKIILIETTLEQAKVLYDFSITGDYSGFDNYKEVINSIGVNEDGPYGWVEINWVEGMINDLSGIIESILNQIEELYKISDFTKEEKNSIDEIQKMLNIFINNQDFINDISKNFELVANYSTDEEFFMINVVTAKDFLAEALPRYKNQIDILKNIIYK